MSRSYSEQERFRRGKARRESALQRNELRQPSDARISPAGVTSAAIKSEDPQIRAMIDEALARRNTA